LRERVRALGEFLGRRWLFKESRLLFGHLRSFNDDIERSKSYLEEDLFHKDQSASYNLTMDISAIHMLQQGYDTIGLPYAFRALGQAPIIRSSLYLGLCTSQQCIDTPIFKLLVKDRNETRGNVASPLQQKKLSIVIVDHALGHAAQAIQVSGAADL
jgi:hypothetical protein